MYEVVIGLLAPKSCTTVVILAERALNIFKSNDGKTRIKQQRCPVTRGIIAICGGPCGGSQAWRVPLGPMQVYHHRHGIVTC